MAALDRVAEKHHTSPTQVSLAWLIARPDITAPIVSATSLKQLDELISATRLRLDAEDIRILNDASAW
ncbi:putative oxidoreductase [compost metagenome]